jgi:hypothetical protein
MTTKIYKSTEKIRAELSDGFCYVRNLEEKGGVISATISENREKHISIILNSIEQESFSEVWDLLNQVKHVRFEFTRN